MGIKRYPFENFGPIVQNFTTIYIYFYGMYEISDYAVCRTAVPERLFRWVKNED